MNCQGRSDRLAPKRTRCTHLHSKQASLIRGGAQRQLRLNHFWARTVRRSLWREAAVGWHIAMRVLVGAGRHLGVRERHTAAVVFPLSNAFTAMDWYAGTTAKLLGRRGRVPSNLALRACNEYTICA